MMRQSGIILVTTMMVIWIITQLILSLLHALLLDLQTTNAVKKQHQRIYSLELVSKNLMSKIVENQSIEQVANQKAIRMDDCVVYDYSPKQLIELLKHNHGCDYYFNKQHYTYIIEDAETFACLRIKQLNNPESSVHFWWLTVALIADNKPTVLQIRIATPVPELVCDSPVKHFIPAGIVSWRFSDGSINQL